MENFEHENGKQRNFNFMEFGTESLILRLTIDRKLERRAVAKNMQGNNCSNIGYCLRNWIVLCHLLVIIHILNYWLLFWLSAQWVQTQADRKVCDCTALHVDIERFGLCVTPTVNTTILTLFRYLLSKHNRVWINQFTSWMDLRVDESFARSRTQCSSKQ